MKKLIAILLMMSCSNVFAEPLAKEITVKEIKAHLKTVNPETTCMDEYVKRRKELILKLSISPVTIAAGTAAATYTSGLASVGLISLSGLEGWPALGYFAGGLMVGAGAGVIATGVDTTATAVTLRNINLILKTLGEYHLERDGSRSELLFKKYLRKSKSDMSQEEFLARLIEADGNGSLCDGSMVKQPRVKIGSKLKFKVAKLKDLAKNL